MASTGGQLVSVSRKYRNGDATWDEVMAAAKNTNQLMMQQKYLMIYMKMQAHSHYLI
tara:strand:- start:113 stop:283 length:171 start_codon:yes stop_codon:yes gene_type:complete